MWTAGGDAEPSSLVVTVGALLSGLLVGGCGRFECVDSREMLFVVSSSLRTVGHAGSGPGTAAAGCGAVFVLQLLRVEGNVVDGVVELLSEPVAFGGIETAVGAGEVKVELVEGVVVGRLGVGAQCSGTLAEQLDVVG